MTSKPKAKRKSKRQQEQEAAAAVLAIDTIATLIITQGGGVLRQSFGFSQKQVTAWAAETLARAGNVINPPPDGPQA